jgi:hypothetical protein
MKKTLLIAFIALFPLSTYSQIKFEKGYFIDNLGKRTNCLIKNIDWKNNPIDFEYKLFDNPKIRTKTITSVKEFAVLNHSKFIRFTVDMDRSNENSNALSLKRGPEFKKETLFLRVLIEGSASLYKYEAKSLMRYFYSVGDVYPKQLIFKYFKTFDDKIGKNEEFKQQLFKDLKCSDISSNEIRMKQYKKQDLMNLFVKYNRCKQSDFTNFDEKGKRDLFNLYIRPGLKYSSLATKNKISETRNIDFGGAFNLRIGVEAEFILPFNKNKWAIIIEPTYQYYKSEKEIIYARRLSTVRTTNVIVNYKSIEIPFGVRHYLFINDDSKLFFNLSYIIDFQLSSRLYAVSKGLFDLDINSRNSLTYGVGYNYKNKYSLELRRQTDREILGDYLYWSTGYKGVSIIFGINMF